MRRTRLRGGSRVAALATMAFVLVVGPAWAVSWSTVATAQSRTAVPPLSGWMPYWTNSASLAAVTANADLFSDVSPFWHDTAANGTGVTITNHVSASARTATLSALRSRAPGTAILPSVTDGTPAGHMAGVLKNAARRDAFVGQLVGLTISYGYDGIDLDFERFAFNDGYSSWAATRPAWVAFVEDLARQLHTRGKLLAVAVPPMYNSKYNSSSGYWVYDFPRIAQHVDRLRVMAYDYSWDTPGPIAPLPWVRTVAAYAGSVVPPVKVQLGVPTYGRDWVRRNSDGSKMIIGTCPTNKSVPTGTIVYTAAQTASLPGKLGLPDSSLKRDAVSGEMVMTYSVTYTGTRSGQAVTCRVHRQAWLADGRTVADRAAVARGYGLRGIATWTIGGEAPDQWALIRGAPTPPVNQPTTGSRRQAVRVLPARASKSGRESVIRGRVLPTRRGIDVVLQRRTRGKWKEWMVTRTSRRGRYGFEFAHGNMARVRRCRVVVPADVGYSRAASRVFDIRPV